MTLSSNDLSVSGYLMDGFVEIENSFTEIELLWQTKYNMLSRAKRYGRWWILKSLKNEYAEQTIYQQMMRKELEMLMKLQHPYIVQAVGFEMVQGLGMCILMEYVDGVRLDDWLATPQNKESRYKLAEELLNAIEYIHAKGIVHRDLKPSNILISRNGEDIKLIDFGLADNDHQAILKQPAGTPHFMSPEQMENAIPDVRNDIYSLGVVLKLLLPELQFSATIKKCLLPIEHRYQNITLLKCALYRAKNRVNRMMIGVFVLLISILSVGLGIQTWRIQSFRNERLHVEEAINKGIQIVDSVILQTGLNQHLDTLTNLVYLSEDFNEQYMDGYQAANKYFDSIRPFFNHVEISEIMNAVTLYCGEKQKVWVDKMESLRLKNSGL